METTALLIKKDDLQKHLASVREAEQEIVNDLKAIVPYVKNKTLLTSLTTRLKKGEECLQALDAGFVPVASGWFTKVDTKSKWQRKMVQETLASMPPQVKEVWDKVKEKGVFDSFSVTVRGGGDPLLVGNKGGKHFFIAGWLPIAPGVGMGFRIKMP